jgi:uncharacterized protein (TIGR02452 family)
MEHFNRRIAVWRDTEATAPPACTPSVKHRLPDMQRVDHTASAGPATKVSVVDADTVDLALAYAARGARPLALVLADDCFPGGCVYTGSGAQEESVFRRTNLHRSLLIGHYPIRDGEAVNCPDITVFKTSEASGFQRMATPRKLDFIACPGLRHPEVAEGRLKEADRARLRDKVDAILHTAELYGHDTIIAGAMGCGAWKNPPEEVALVWREALDRGDWAGTSVRNVAFAILGGTAPGYVTMMRYCDGERNAGVFSRVFRV